MIWPCPGSHSLWIVFVVLQSEASSATSIHRQSNTKDRCHRSQCGDDKNMRGKAGAHARTHAHTHTHTAKGYTTDNKRQFRRDYTNDALAVCWWHSRRDKTSARGSRKAEEWQPEIYILRTAKSPAPHPHPPSPWTKREKAAEAESWRVPACPSSAHNSSRLGPTPGPPASSIFVRRRVRGDDGGGRKTHYTTVVSGTHDGEEVGWGSGGGGGGEVRR